MSDGQSGESAEPVKALFTRAEEAEREALYSVVGRLLEGWTPNVRTGGVGSCWLWHNRATTKPAEPMSPAESTVMRVARKMRDEHFGSTAAPDCPRGCGRPSGHEAWDECFGTATNQPPTEGS